jgi:diacylglycerol kinase (ATP)
MNRNKVHVIINPASAAGRTGARQKQIRQLLDRHLGGEYLLHVTALPLEATSLARNAIRGGCDLVIAVGGDGTIQETVNGFFADGRPINSQCRLGIIGSGTGLGFCQSLGLPETLAAQAELACRGGERIVDIGHVTFSDGTGQKLSRYFVNECQAGIGGEVVRKVRSRQKLLGGRAAFGLSTLAAAFTYPDHLMSVKIDNQRLEPRRLIAVMVGNGNRAAGGMQLTPQARVDDGRLDVMLIHQQALPCRLLNFSRIYSGRHQGQKDFQFFKGRCIEIESAAPIGVEADGEWLGHLPCRIEVIGAALRVMARPGPKEE